MSTVYDLAPKEITALAAKVMHAHHGDLESAGVTIHVLVAYCYDKAGEPQPAMKLRGHPVLARTSITSLQDRVRGLPDAKIVIDREYGWTRLSESRREALVDRELTKLVLQFDDEGDLKLDDHSRPKLKIKPYDWSIEGYESVAARYGEASVEIQQVTRWSEQWGQLALFPLAGTKPVTMEVKKTLN
jgi:hypothetical protein